MSNYLKPKYCIRCEEPILTHQERFYRAVILAGKTLVSYFCAPCFKVEMPKAFAELMK